MSLINVSHLTFAYDGSYDNIFDDASFQIDTAWRLGFVGRNGRGKTTFLRLLLGEYEYRGTISHDMEFRYFPFSIEDMSEYTIDVLKNICPDAEDWELMRETSLLEIETEVLYRPFGTLSSGERTKCMLAALFLLPNTFLLIDEPTNHLDAHAREVVGEYLRKKNGFILVSHDRRLLDRCVDHILSITRATIEVQRGNYASWQHNKQLRDEFELAENEKHRKEIKRLEETAREKAQWSDTAESRKIGFDPRKVEKSLNRRPMEGAKAKKAMARAKAIEQRVSTEIEEKSALLHDLEKNDALILRPLNHHSGWLVELKDVAIRYGDHEVCFGVDLTVNSGERVAIRGRNGCGKSSIIKLICGEEIEHDGTVRLASGLVISRVSQETSHLRGTLSEYAFERGIDETRFLTLLRKMDFQRVQFAKRMEDFSEGQKKKVLIAASLCESAHLYVWDEPLNYIDLLSRIQIEDMLADSGASMIFVEHDAAFTDKIATRIFDM